MPKARRGGRSEEFCTRKFREREVFEVTPRKYRERERVVIQVIVSMCRGQLSYGSTADDLASDLIERVWSAHGFGWDLGSIKAYVRSAIRTEMIKVNGNKTLAASQFGDAEGFDMGEGPGLDLLAFVGHREYPRQDKVIEAHEALALVASLPDNQRECLLILADGGSPLDVARDMEMEPWAAVRLIKEARVNIHRVDPSWDEAA